MGDLKSAKLIYLKGFLFLCCGAVSAGLLYIDLPQLRTLLLQSISIWCFCRFYYFAFYVIQHYVDEDFRFTGLFDFCLYVLKKRKAGGQ